MTQSLAIANVYIVCVFVTMYSARNIVRKSDNKRMTRDLLYQRTCIFRMSLPPGNIISAVCLDKYNDSWFAYLECCGPITTGRGRERAVLYSSAKHSSMPTKTYASTKHHGEWKQYPPAKQLYYTGKTTLYNNYIFRVIQQKSIYVVTQPVGPSFLITKHDRLPHLARCNFPVLLLENDPDKC